MGLYGTILFCVVLMGAHDLQSEYYLGSGSQ
jgi:hypothetical protein